MARVIDRVKFSMIMAWMLTPLAGVPQVTSSFSIEKNTCLGEELVFQNNSSGATDYQWDFCLSDLDSIPKGAGVLTLSAAATPTAMTLQYDSGLWYGFVSSRGNNKIFRLDFGTSLDSLPAVQDLGTYGNGPRNIRFFQEAGVWYGLMINWGNETLSRLVFPAGLGSTPGEVNLGNLSSWNNPRGLDLVKTSDSIIAVVASEGNDKLTLLNFGNSILNTPSGMDIMDIGVGEPLVDGPNGVRLMKQGSNWYGILSSKIAGKVLRMQFGSNLFSDPSFVQLHSVANPTELVLKNEGPNIHAFVATQTGSLQHLAFGNNIAAAPAITSHGTLGTLSNHFAFDLARTNPSWRGFGIDFVSKEISRISFPDSCSTSVISTSSSTEEVPLGITFLQSGTFAIELSAFDSFGNRADTTKFHTVLTDQAPLIDFVTQNACLLNSNDFAGSSTDDPSITDWNWDFGDMTTASNQMVTHQYLSAGEYDVELEVVSLTGCKRSITRSLAIYEAPTADFDIPVGTLCTSASLTFVNTSLGVDADSAEFTWDFNGEGTTNTTDGVFNFATSGIKNIDLTIDITGCISSISQPVTLNDGPQVDFDWSGNCFGQAVQFNDKSMGSGITGYEWDFGDASPINNDQNPTHTYATADTFSVELTVDNSLGCSNSFMTPIVVNAMGLAGFSIDDAVSNVPINFQGQDLTSLQDSIIGWDWEFDGLGTASTQNPMFTFSDTGSYQVSLSVMTAQSCSFDTTKTVEVGTPPAPLVDFTPSANNCLQGAVSFQNNTLNGQEYIWDFCLDALDSIPVAETLVTISTAQTPTALTIEYDSGKWYGFLSSRGNDKIFRLDFGASIQSIPSYTDLGEFGDGPRNLEFFQEDGKWYALMINWSSATLSRLAFDGGLASVPTETDLGNLSSWANPRGLDLVVDNGSIVAIISSESTDKLTLLNFGNSILNTPVGPDVLDIGVTEPLVDGPNGIQLVQQGPNWYGVLNSKLAGKVLRMSFGSNLFSEPTFDELLSVTNPTQISLLREGTNYHAYLTAQTGELYNIAFGDDLSNPVPETRNLGDFGLLNNIFGFDLIKSSPSWTGLAVDFVSNEVFRISFSDSCTAGIVSKPFATEFDPLPVSYAVAGDHAVELTAKDGSGNASSITKLVNVLALQAPPVDFEVENACVSSTIGFMGTGPPSTISYAWDFGDDTGASGQSVDHDYDTAGIYQVQLSIDDGTCTNIATRSVPIYEEPVPGFLVVSDPLCSNSPVLFTNSTTGEAGDSVTWAWDFAGVGTSSEKEPDFTFPQSGPKVVSLTASIPGCINQFDTTLSVLEGPQASFLFENPCFGELSEFNNTSTGSGIASYSWDFGNGVGSSLVNPSMVYQAVGDYGVALAVENDLGCITTAFDTLTVHGIPKTDFGNELACRGVDVQFSDSTVVENANLDTWLWTFVSDTDPPSEITYDIPDPVHQFASTGQYEVRLRVNSVYGCQDSITRVIDVLESPEVDFNWLTPCVDDSVHFLDLSTGNGPTQPVGWNWEVAGQSLSDQSPTFVFAEADTFEVSLTVTSQNLCRVDTTKQVVINPLPIPGFRVEDACANLPTVFVDTTESVEPIASRRWDLGGLGQSFEEQFSFQFPEPGPYQISLQVMSESGCVDQLIDTVVIHDIPTSHFEVEEAIGGSPFLVEFFNNSTSASSYLWDFGTGDTSVLEEVDFEFRDLGSYLVQLRATNEFGCTDTFSEIIRVVNPRVDVSLEQIRTVIDQDKLEMILTIANKGNLVIRDMDLIIEIPGQISLAENLTAPIGPEEKLNYRAKFEILNTATAATHVCFNLVVNDPVQEEFDLSNNFDCLNLAEQAVFLDSYPNPVADQLSIPLVLPAPNPVQFQLLAEDGALVLQQTWPQPKIGLNVFLLEVGTLRQGMYFLKTRYGNVENTQKLVKQ